MFGLPIISTGEGGIHDIVTNGKTGFIVSKQNPNLLAKKIKWFIDKPHEASLMGEKGYEHFLKNYSLPVFEKKLAYILNQI